VAGRAAVRTDRALEGYAIAVGVTVVAILSQYFVPELLPSANALYGNLPGDLGVVYGIPIAAFATLVGAGPLRRWYGSMETAAYQGLLWYAGLSLLAIGVTLGLGIVYLSIDPSAIHLLNRPNPALTQAAGDPWFWVGFSFVVGAVEETIFRGWIFGFWSARARDWLVPATGSSAIFAAVHLYYGTTYGIAAPLIFPSLFFLGFAFAATYQRSGGNLVVVAILHGAYDASAFLFAYINPGAGLALRYLPVLVGAVLLLLAIPGGGGPVAAPAEPRPDQGHAPIGPLRGPSGPS